MTETAGRLDAVSHGAERATGRRRSDRIVGASRAIQDVVEKAVGAAASELPVHIHGPEGSGKEHTARAIHSWSTRAGGPFVVVSCVGVAEALLGRELFGCAASTYPNFPEAHDGALQRAAGGTVMIDHADALPGNLLQAFSKGLEDGRFEREGDGTPLALRARVILVSRAPLSPSPFRDLAHHTIEMPSLEERGDDILPLATHFLRLHAEDLKVQPVGFTTEARAALTAERWTGNVRELSERIGQALRLAGSGAISAEALMLSAQAEEVPSFKEAKRAFERRYVTSLLRRCDGNISRAARLAKKDRKDFYDVIRRTGVNPADFR
ncbi:MAG: sigma 54-interacting transcriptional regulator [Myxococcota bacterium]